VILQTQNDAIRYVLSKDLYEAKSLV